MQAIAGAIVTLAGALLWGLGAVANNDSGTAAIVGGIFLCAVGLLMLFASRPLKLNPIDPAYLPDVDDRSRPTTPKSS